MWSQLILSSATVLVLAPAGAGPTPAGAPAAAPAPSGQVRSIAEGPPPILPRSPDGSGHGASRVLSGPRVPPSGPRRVIVELAAEPAALARRAGRSPLDAGRGLAALRADLAARTGTAAGATFEITREYTQVFAGAAVTLDAASVEWLRSRAYVAGVFPDDTVRATLAETVPLIGAQRVVQELNGTGAGIRVGIIDTGIDYRHPALGAGYGPGFRVAGGWDFANGDSDPLDDNGHGTHVAGIVGGNGGGIVGVAPAVTFYAFKVLSASGFGWQSDVLAGLDRVPDPDGNPATDDGAHVINLSLGGPGHADDPLSRALDRLTDLGVVCVVAAGNDYSYFTIGSPGTSRQAITVGASTKTDNMAFFSSRGPSPRTFDLKPDLVAPGVDVVSAALGGGTVALSGTSMATPHVAGVAAQLRQLHPGWSVAQLQAALVSTAHDIGWQPFDQGAGRVDAYAAATASLVVTPTKLSYGRIDPNPPTWSRRDTLHVSSLATEERTVVFPATTTVTAGATLTVTPASVTVAPGGTATVIAELVVDNAALPAPMFKPYGYATTILVTSGAEIHRLPVALHEAATIEVPTSAFVNWILVHDRGATGFLDTFTPIFDGPSLPLPAGDYDVMAWLSPPVPPHAPSAYVVREHVAIAGDTRVPLEMTDATVRLRFENVSEIGAPVACNLGAFSLHHEQARFGFANIAPFIELQVSQASPAYRLEWWRTATDFRQLRYTFNGALSGIQSSRTLSNRPDELRVLSFEAPQVAPSVAPIFWDHLTPHGYSRALFAIFDPTIAPIRGPFAAKWWWMPAPYAGHIQHGGKLDLVAWDYGTPVEDSLVAVGPLLELDRWPFAGFAGDPPWTPWFIQSSDRLALGEAPLVWHGRFDNEPTRMHLSAGWPFQGAHLVTDRFGGKLRHPDPAYVLTRDGTEVRQGYLTDTGRLSSGEFTLDGLSAGSHELRTTYTASLRGQPARLNVVAGFDPSRPDPNPPWLRSLHVEVDGELTDHVEFLGASEAAVRFELVEEQTYPLQPTVEVRPAGGTWEPLVVTLRGDGHTAALPPHLDGEVEMRLDAVDGAGNRLALHWDRAFSATPASPSVLITSPSASVGEGVVHLSWLAISVGPIRVGIERRGVMDDWFPIGTAQVGASGGIEYADSTAEAGKTYGYRVRVPNAGQPIHGGEIWITVNTGFQLALAGPRPSPVTVQPFEVELSLESSAPARLTVMDVAGRRVLKEDLAAPDRGRRRIRLGVGHALRPGLYFLRLEQGGRVVARRISILGR